MKLKKRPVTKPTLVFNQHGKCVTTSKIVAEIFDKEHYQILRDIRSLIKQLQSVGECTSIFVLSYEINKLANNRRDPYYELDRDAFTLLVMGFTGEKALKWKLKFLEAFNLMEAELLKRIYESRQKAFEKCDATMILRNQSHGYQRENSNIINSVNVASKQDAFEGRVQAQNYNFRNCLSITERTPRNWRDEGNMLGLPKYVCRSAKEVARRTQPEMAASRSIADELVAEGIDESVAFEIGRALIVPCKMLIDSGYTGVRSRLRRGSQMVNIH